MTARKTLEERVLWDLGFFRSLLLGLLRQGNIIPGEEVFFGEGSGATTAAQRPLWPAISGVHVTGGAGALPGGVSHREVGSGTSSRACAKFFCFCLPHGAMPVAMADEGVCDLVEDCVPHLFLRAQLCEVLGQGDGAGCEVSLTGTLFCSIPSKVPRQAVLSHEVQGELACRYKFHTNISPRSEHDRPRLGYALPLKGDMDG